jgi:hypothetical protein
MPPEKAYTQQAITDFGHRLSAWSRDLNDVEKAMLIDLLAKAGGDIYGNDSAQRVVTPAGKDTDASALSPLELDSFADAVRGIFAGE